MFKRHVENKEKAKTTKTTDLINENITEEKDKSQSKQTTKVKKVIRKKIIKEGDKKQLAPKEARVSKRVSRKPKHDGFVENYTSDEEVSINVQKPKKKVSFKINDEQTPENNAALMRQQKNKEEIAAKFKELDIPLLNSENTGIEADEVSSSDPEWNI